MRISDWSSDVCSSDLGGGAAEAQRGTAPSNPVAGERRPGPAFPHKADDAPANAGTLASEIRLRSRPRHVGRHLGPRPLAGLGSAASRATVPRSGRRKSRSEEHTSELKSLMRISYAVFCLKKKI